MSCCLAMILPMDGELFDRGLEIVQAAGDHISMVSDENIAGLARQISSVIDRYEVELKLSVGTVRSGDEIHAGRSLGEARSDRELSRTEERAVI